MLSYSAVIIITILLINLAFEFANKAILLLVFAQVAFLALSVIYLLYCKAVLKAKVSVPIGLTEAGKETLVKIKISKKGIFPIMKARALVVVKGSMDKKGNKFWMKLPPIVDREAVFTNNIIISQAGSCEIIIKKLRIYDLTGLVYMTKTITKSDYVRIMPKIWPVAITITSAIKNFYGESDKYDEYSPGHDSSELFSVREYRPGDKLQNIHWKLTAKQNEIMVKENSLPKACPIVFLLDYKLTKKNKKNKNVANYLDLIASLSFSMMDAGCYHYVAWFDESKNDTVRVPVFDEESFYFFVMMLMVNKWSDENVNISDKYKEKFYNEPYVWKLSLDENLVLKKEDEIIGDFYKGAIEDMLLKMEIIL